MKMRSLILGITFLFVLGAASLMAQTMPPGSMPPVRQGQGGMGRRGGPPCWKQAGISQSAMQQERQIQQNTRSQVEAVCANSSLSPQQKHEQIRQIHEQARRQMESIITPQQHQALESCRAQRGEGRNHMGGMRHGAGGGPCGEMPMGNQGGSTTPPPTPPQAPKN
jgi:Spy/CpxP family protein refolding chaperone